MSGDTLEPIRKLEMITGVEKRHKSERKLPALCSLEGEHDGTVSGDHCHEVPFNLKQILQNINFTSWTILDEQIDLK